MVATVAEWSSILRGLVCDLRLVFAAKTGLKSAFVGVIWLFTTGAVAAEVKLSKNGICHDTSSPSYVQTTRYTAYPSLDSCLAAGGRLPKGARTGNTSAPAQRQQPASGYSREAFAHWIDADGDCQNTRHEILAQLSTGTVRYSANGCSVVRGQWRDPYTDRLFVEARDLDIDHLVPLHWAWGHGADGWSAERRQQFANDPANLFAVQASVNRDKGASGPLEWLPPAAGFHCQYVTRFIRVVKTYRLALSADEGARLASLHAGVCSR